MPRHPYRDTAIFYGVLAGMVVAVGALSGGGVRRSLIVAGGLFVVATLYSSWRWHARLRQEREDE